MKRLIAICITAIICTAIFAIPLYYETFFKVEAAPAPQVAATKEIKDKYLMANDGECVVILNQDTGSVYWITGMHALKFIGDLSYVK